MATAAHKVTTTFVLPRTLRAEVAVHCRKTGAPMGAVMRLALIDFLEKHKDKELDAESICAN